MSISLATHHKLHLARVGWLSFLVVGLLGIQLVYNYQASGKPRVLAYSTNVSVGGLHSLTNQERAAYGLAALSLNGKLNSAAQAKAGHMIANNYWAHTSPDGVTPWYWFGWAGYSYTNAGENLAYGFADSAGVIQGWMNSPGHKANVLGSYKDVGFGYANGANYQGGQYTVVVAMYGTSVSQPAPPPAAPAAPKNSTPSTPAPQQVAPAAPAEPAPAQPAETPKEETEPAKETPKEEPNKTEDETPVAATKVTTVEQALTGKAAWPLYASLSVISASMVGFGVTHTRLVRYSWLKGMNFAYTHPMLDAAVVSAIVLFFFSTTIGHIR